MEKAGKVRLNEQVNKRPGLVKEDKEEEEGGRALGERKMQRRGWGGRERQGQGAHAQAGTPRREMETGQRIPLMNLS